MLFEGIATFLGLLIPAGGFAVVGAVIHDIRRIAVNTSEETLSGLVAAAVGRAKGAATNLGYTGGPAPSISFYYVQNGTEHGPVSQSRMTELLRSKRVTPFQKIERSVNGVREPFDPRELGF